MLGLPNERFEMLPRLDANATIGAMEILFPFSPLTILFGHIDEFLGYIGFF